MRPVKFDLEHITIHGVAYGEKDAPIILCLHGWLDNAASFTPLSQYFPTYQLICIDLPGHGLSAHRSAGAYYHFVDWISDLHALFELNQWQKVHILAHSMGAMIATVFAATFPEKVTSLTMIDAIGLFTLSADETTQQLKSGLLSRQKLSAKQIKYHPNIDSAIKARMHVSDLNYENAQLLVERSIIETAQGYCWRYDNRLLLVAPYRFTIEQAIDLIKNISAPCLFIGGKHGAQFVNAAKKLYEPLFKNISCYSLVGGHHVHMEKPQEVGQLISNFIEK